MNVIQVCIVSVKDLKAAVTSAIKSVTKRNYEILTYFSCTNTKSGLTITGYDLQTGVSNTIESEWQADCKFLIPAHTLKTWISKQSGDCQIAIIETEEGKAVRLTVGKTSIGLPSRDFEDYPVLPQWDAPIATLELDVETLGKAITACKKFVANDYTQPSINGVNFSSANGFLTIQSTNRHVISRYQVKADSPEFSLTISPDSLVMPKKGKVKLNFYAEYISVNNDNNQTLVKTIDEAFPALISDWQPTINNTLSVDKKALLNQLEIALAYSKDIVLHLYTEGDRLRIMGECEDGALFVELPATVHSKAYMTSISGKYFKDTVSLSQSVNVTLAFNCDWYGQTDLLGVIGRTSQFVAKTVSKRLPSWLENAHDSQASNSSIADSVGQYR